MLIAGYDITVTVRRQCKRMILRCVPGERRLALSVPPGVSKKAVERFVTEQQPWIEEHLQGTAGWQPSYAAGERHWLLGQRVTLGTAGIPAGMAAFYTYRAEKLDALIRRLLPMWTKRMGVTPTGIRYRDMTSRWGSCQTVTGMITLNLRLGLMPVECVEYVLVHELCHLLHPNHSSAFHEAMTAFMPSWQKRREAMRTMDITPLPPL